LEQRIPSIGWATRHGAALKGVGAAAGIEGLQFTKTDLHRIRGMIPLQNTFYLAWLFNQLEQDIALSAELPDKTNARHLKRY
jgi:hypothetical protein